MAIETKGPDRLNVSKKAKDIIDRIDDSDYLCLGNKSSSRSELFLFAMALGCDTLPTPPESIYPGGLILEKAIDSSTLASIYALFLYQHKGEDIDAITNKGEVFRLAQEYANTGFENLEDYMNTKKSDEDLAWELLRELDEQYEALEKSTLF